MRLLTVPAGQVLTRHARPFLIPFPREAPSRSFVFLSSVRCRPLTRQISRLNSAFRPFPFLSPLPSPILLVSLFLSRSFFLSLSLFLLLLFLLLGVSLSVGRHTSSRRKRRLVQELGHNISVAEAVLSLWLRIVRN